MANQIDEALQRFNSQLPGLNQTPFGSYNPVTPLAGLIPSPPPPPPVFSMQVPVGQFASAQQMAYQQVQQNYMSPTASIMAGAQYSHYPNASMSTMPSMGAFRMLAPPPPPPMGVTPGVTGSFVNPYDAAISGMMQRQSYIYGDPAQARSRYSGMKADEFGSSGWGMGISAGMAGVGMAIGGPLGAGLGALGGWAVNSAVGLGQSIYNYNDVRDMGYATRLQGGTQGLLSMGRGDMGMGGRGMNAQSARGLTTQLQGLAGQSGGSANINDMINLTNVAAESGLLNEATNVDQIFTTVKKLTGLIGQMAKLTGDPDFRNNVREIGNMSRLGFTLDQIPGVVGGMNASARMAGMSRGEIQGYADQGSMIYRQLGLTTGTGAAQGAFSAGMSRIGAGALSPRLMNLMGGESGLTQHFTEMAGGFAANQMQLMLPHLITQGSGGNLGIDEKKLQDFLSGKGDLTQMMGQGAAKLDPATIQKLMTQKPELLSQLSEMAGPEGIVRGMLGQTQRMQKQLGVSFESAASTLWGAEKGRAFAQWARAPGTRERLLAGAEEEDRREDSNARGLNKGRARARKEESSKWGVTRAWENWDVWDWHENPNVALEERAKQDEASTGRKGVYDVTGITGGLEAAATRRAEMMGSQGSGPMSTDAAAELMSRRGVSGWSVGGVGMQYANVSAGTATGRRIAATLEKELRANDANLKIADQFGGDRKKVLDFQKGLSSKVTGGKDTIDRMKVFAQRYVAKLGENGQAFVWDDLEKALKNAFGNMAFDEAGADLKTFLMGYITTNGDPNVKKAVTNAKDEFGLLSSGGDPKKAQEKVVKRYENFLESMFGEDETTAEGRQLINSMLNAGGDVATALALIGEGTEEADRMLAELEEQSPKTVAMAREIEAGLAPEGRDALREYSKKIGASKRGITATTQYMRGKREEIIDIAATAKRAGKDLSTLGNMEEAGSDKAKESGRGKSLKAIAEMLPAEQLSEIATRMDTMATAAKDVSDIIGTATKQDVGTDQGPMGKDAALVEGAKNLWDRMFG